MADHYFLQCWLWTGQITRNCGTHESQQWFDSVEQSKQADSSDSAHTTYTFFPQAEVLLPRLWLRIPEWTGVCLHRILYSILVHISAEDNPDTCQAWPVNDYIDPHTRWPPDSIAHYYERSDRDQQKADSHYLWAYTPGWDKLILGLARHHRFSHFKSCK